MWEKHGHLIATGGKREEHLRNEYLSHDPCCLGGRAVGLPGQSGSNNSGEKRNHLIKGYLKHFTNNLMSEEKANIIYVVAACAMDLTAQHPIQKFAVQPQVELGDYNILRAMYNEALRNSGKLILDTQYAVATAINDRSSLMNLCEVIGDSDCSFTLHIPTSSTVYTHVLQEEKISNPISSVASIYELSDTGCLGDRATNTPKHALTLLDSYDDSRKTKLYKRLILDCVANTPGRKENESFLSYIHRRCQRNPETITTNRTKQRLLTLKKKRSLHKKKKPTPIEMERRAQADKQKHCNTVDEETPVVSEYQCPMGAQVESAGDEEWITWDEECTFDQIVESLVHAGIDVENDNMLHSLVGDMDRVSLKRQLGSWIEVDVDGMRGRVTCNCEDYNFHYTCIHQCTLNVLQFGRLPDIGCSKANERWEEIRTVCIKYWKEHAIDMSGVDL